MEVIVTDYKKIILTLLVCGFAQLHAIFYQVDLWQNTDLQQTIVCLSDDHHTCENEKAWSEQQDALIVEAKKRTAYVVAEDMDDHQSKHAALQVGWWEGNPAGAPLIGLIKKCRKSWVACNNVEFRQLCTYRAALGINKKLLDPDCYRESVAKISTADLIQETNDIIHEIGIYKDGAIFKKEYDTIFEKLQIDYALVRLIQVECEFFNRDLIELYHALALASWRLLDARILHQIATNKKEKCIFIAAGGAHIENINTMLPKLGFKKLSGTKKECIYTGQQDNRRISAASAVDIAKFFTDFE